MLGKEDHSQGSGQCLTLENDLKWTQGKPLGDSSLCAPITDANEIAVEELFHGRFLGEMCDIFKDETKIYHMQKTKQDTQTMWW